jgi:hypothetical protein
MARRIFRWRQGRPRVTESALLGYIRSRAPIVRRLARLLQPRSHLASAVTTGWLRAAIFAIFSRALTPRSTLETWNGS